ncbi:cation:proton antiporter [Tranquillimonas alkanivorans]|uniref:Transporter, CPA2 family n=1 Tax=Tranquillimonas alkanivorans TaxID=441119 RepID=A0A1I5PKV8_9RHOB|nr:cation:proton antiporter [Tranquillimonas alkanivorans]SFP34685.1 transporter, CPA2 family [Tranquillimonas alkanivorans]
MEWAPVLAAIGVLFLAGLALDALGHRVHVPRVTLLILLGVALGRPGLDLLPLDIDRANAVLAPTALTMVAFLLGGSLDRRTLAAQGREIMIVSVTLALLSMMIVAGGLWLIGAPVVLAVMLGAISTATAPAATRDVVRQSPLRDSRFARTILGIVAIDDVWGLVIFSAALTAAGVIAGGEANGALAHGAREAGGAVALGLIVGVPAAYLTGRLKPGEPTLLEALGVVFLIAGIALWLELSYLLAGIVCGAVVVNLARHHDQPFHEIERIEWPFLLLFFVMAGASLEVEHLRAAGLLGVAYFVLRIAGRLAGGWGGGRLAGLSGRRGVLTGMGLMPQAGVAVGMALVASERFPQHGDVILAVTIGTTVAFELIGPVMTQAALTRAARTPEAQPEPES